MPPYGSTTRGPLRTRKSVASGSPSGDCAKSSRPDRPAGRPPKRPGTCSVRMRNPARSAVSRGDPVELAEPVAVRVHHHDARRSRLVDVLAPLLPEVAERRFVGAQVDEGVDAGWIGAAGRHPAPRSARRRAPSGSSGPSSSISGSMRRCDTRPAASDRSGRTRSVNAAMSSADHDRATARAARRRSPTVAAGAFGRGSAHRWTESHGADAPTSR